MSTESESLLTYIISQGGHFSISDGLVKISLGTNSLVVSTPQMFYYDFKKGLDELTGILKSVVALHQANKELDIKVKNVLTKSGLTSVPSHNYDKFYSVVSYLVCNKVDILGEKIDN